MATIRVKIADKVLGAVDFDEMTLRDAFAIKAASGLTPAQLFQGTEQMDPDALQTLVWFVRMKNGESVDRSTIDFRLRDLSTEAVEQDPNPAEGSPEPTPSEV